MDNEVGDNRPLAEEVVLVVVGRNRNYFRPIRTVMVGEELHNLHTLDDGGDN